MASITITRPLELELDPTRPVGSSTYAAVLALAAVSLAFAWTWAWFAPRRSKEVDPAALSPPILALDLGPGESRDKQANGRCAAREDAEKPHAQHFPDLSSPTASPAERAQMSRDKELYHALQNLEDHNDAPARARARLIELLDRTMHADTADPTSIASIHSYTPDALRAFFHAAHTTNAHAYEAYIARRRAGGPREMFPTREYAVQWLKLAAPVKYVDGSWVGNVLNAGHDVVHAPLLPTIVPSKGVRSERTAAKMAWQVITEEFGDGDLAKNHVYLYYQLIRSLDPSARPGNEAGFDGLSPTEGSHRCWTAAVAQQCVGLMAGTSDFHPEALGFNMAYETLPYHLLVTSRELRELRIDDYYFALHITIDNPDSGHAALARLAVERFLEGVRERDGDDAMQMMWRRVQAGVILADGLPTTPAGPIEMENRHGSWVPRPQPVRASQSISPTAVEERMVELLINKSLASEKMHCSSRVRIEGSTIEEWLEPASFPPDKALRLLRALGRKRPWVVPGDSAASRFMRELQWGGRMFGAFSNREVELVRRWIAELGDVIEVTTPGEAGAYERFIGGVAKPNRQEGQEGSGRFARLAADLLAPVSDAEVTLALAYPTAPRRIDLDRLDVPSLACIWFTHLALLEHFALSPSRLASLLGMLALRVLRALEGFPDLHAPDAVCAGTDHVSRDTDQSHINPDDDAIRGLWEIGQDVFAREGLSQALTSFASSAASVPPDGEVAALCGEMLVLRARPYTCAGALMGCVRAGLGVYASERVRRCMLPEESEVVARIVAEVEGAIDQYVLGSEGYREAGTGMGAGQGEFVRQYEAGRAKMAFVS